jgi:hypothetical protein
MRTVRKLLEDKMRGGRKHRRPGLRWTDCTISLKAAVLPGHQRTGPSEEEEGGRMVSNWTRKYECEKMENERIGHSRRGTCCE